MKGGFTVSARARSFAHAARGIARLLRSQHNAWLHALATLIVLVLALFLGLPVSEWRWLVVAIALVWTAEAFNTAIEALCDAVTSERHPLIRDAKDVAAGGVLLAAIGAAAIGLSVLGPPLLRALCPTQ